MITLIDGKELVTPILREDISFAYRDEHYEEVGALGRADYYEDCTVITHTGYETVAFELLHLNITHLKVNGEFVLAKRIAPTKDGAARFLIRHGYDYYYPREEKPAIAGDIGGIDAWTALHPADRQLHLGECKTLRDGAPKVSDLHAAYNRGAQ